MTVAYFLLLGNCQCNLGWCPEEPVRIERYRQPHRQTKKETEGLTEADRDKEIEETGSKR